MKKILLITIAVCGWFAIISQYYLVLKNNSGTFFEVTINFFSYFTIIVNLLVAICVSMLLLGTWQKPKAITAIAVYITIVGVTYNLILRFIWNPQGLQKLTDELLHSVNPVLFVVFWIAFAPKGDLKWKDALTWLIFPLVYSIYTLAHGLLTGWYPYPFIDPGNVGWNKVAINSVLILVAFLVVGLIAVGIAHLSRRSQKT